MTQDVLFNCHECGDNIEPECVAICYICKNPFCSDHISPYITVCEDCEQKTLEELA